MKENHFNCIYLYTNKINGKKYVGQTVNFNKRHNDHIYSSYNENRHDYNYTFHKAIRKYGINNFEIDILKEDLKDYQEMDYWECFYINEFNTLANNRGYNVSSGGSNGNTFAGKTKEEMDEFRKKISEIHKGKTLSDETKQKMSESKKGEKHPMYNKKRPKHSERMKGEKHPMYNKGYLQTGSKNASAKKVIQYDLDGNIIKVWDYIKEISETLGFNYNTLYNYLNGKYKGKPYKGYIWEYYEGD